jgi:hypothetical protein
MKAKQKARTKGKGKKAGVKDLTAKDAKAVKGGVGGEPRAIKHKFGASK